MSTLTATDASMAKYWHDKFQEQSDVLAWASENVWVVQFNANRGTWQGTITNGGPFEGDTIYEALLKAWYNREKGEKGEK